MSDNHNLRFARLLIDGLIAAGVQHACIAPGSRSTPLTLAFSERADITHSRHLDERSAAFFALGRAMRTRQPVALVCTSGSALANFFPAVIEAHQSGVPLILLTGDRPHELRASGANQTIDQIKFYGDYALWSVDLPPPEVEMDALTARYLATTAARAITIACSGRRGVVHLNIPFRKPLEPSAQEWTNRPALPVTGAHHVTVLLTAAPVPAESAVRAIIDRCAANPRGVIVVGGGVDDPRFADRVNRLAEVTSYPIFSDPTSGLRHAAPAHWAIIAAYETFLQGETPIPPADLVLRFGKPPTSKWLTAYLDRSGAGAYIQVSADGVWADDLHKTTHFLHADPVALCDSLTAAAGAYRPDPRWQDDFPALETRVWEAIDAEISDQTFDGAFVADLVALLPEQAILFVGNSLPIRHVDQFARPRFQQIDLYANRGASGIDGNISTAIGVASASDRPVVLLVGDVTFYHDMNGLLALRNVGISNITIILMNNNGGGIFQRLPIEGIAPQFNDLFIMPHDLNFAHSAALYGLMHHVVSERGAFGAAFAEAIASPKPHLIEVMTDSAADEQVRRQIVARVKARVFSKSD